jgi:glycosyltransferase involved in cell wall biosynthesis
VKLVAVATKADATMIFPLISCLMVTRGAINPARFAIECYQRQTHPQRELVIVTDTLSDAFRDHIRSLNDQSIRVVEVPAAPLGDLRNLSVEAARGALVAQWDDDDLCHPERLTRQYEALVAKRVEMIFLERWTMWWPARRRLAISEKRPWEGTLLAKKDALPAYPPLAIGEDHAMLEEAAKTRSIGLLDHPELYCYVKHSANTCPTAYFEQRFKLATKRSEFADYEPALAALSMLPISDYLAWADPDSLTDDEKVAN